MSGSDLCDDNRAAIQAWFEEHDSSPMTNTTLESKTLLPNLTLRSVIHDTGSGAGV